MTSMGKDVSGPAVPQNAIRYQRLKDALVAATLANLVFLRVWSYLLDRHESAYLAETPYNPVGYIAILINTGVFALVFYLGARCVSHRTDRWSRELATLAFFMFLLPAIDCLRRSLGLSLDRLWFVGGVWLLIGLVLIGIGVLPWRVLLRRTLYRVLLILFPFVVTTAVQAVWIAINGERPKPEELSLPFPNGPKAPSPHRVVWVIFDEWDQRVTFDRRPPGLALPHIDAFAKNAVVATQAYSPAGATALSIPSILTGRYVEDVKFGGSDSLLVQAAGETTHLDFRRMPNLLTEAATVGKRVAIVGWYHPYSRLFPHNDHFWVRWGAAVGGQMFRANTVFGALHAQLRFVFAPHTARQSHADLYAKLHAAARLAVASRAVDVAFIHYPIPHLPGIYDRERQVLSARISFNAGDLYADNLALVDQTLGQLMADLDTAGLRGCTTVVLSSDHWWRTADVVDGQLDYRIPLMLQMGSDREGKTCTTRINTVSATPIIAEILGGLVNDHNTILARLQAAEVREPFHYATGGQRRLLNAPVVQPTVSVAK